MVGICIGIRSYLELFYCCCFYDYYNHMHTVQMLFNGIATSLVQNGCLESKVQASCLCEQ